MNVDTTFNIAGTQPPHVYEKRFRQYDFGPSRDFRFACPTVAEGKTGPTAAGLSARVSVPCAFARRMQDIESDTAYDRLRCLPDGAIALMSQTSVYDTG